MTRRRVGIVLALIAGLCLAGGLFGSGAASAERNGKVQLSVGGRAFTAQPTGPLVDTSRLAPGIGVSATFGVRSKFDVATKISLQMTNIRDDDNGCGTPEAQVDTTCGQGQGELGRNLIVSIASAPTRNGSFRQVWQGAALQLATVRSLGVAVPGKTDRWLRLTAAVPASVGNVVESDTFRFGIELTLAGNGVSGGSGVAGEHTGGGHSSGSGVGGLAATGFTTALFVIGGVLLVSAGTMLLSAGRRQRGTTSASSSTERRAPRPASPR